MEKNNYNVAIVGGGLAGLAASILLSRMGHRVILFEKEKYPFHKVCGEYISLESWNFLKELGLPLDDLHLPLIDTLFLTAPNGKSFETKLPQGGFGISRYKIDQMLAHLAKQNTVTLMEETRVDEINFDSDFHISFQTKNKTVDNITAKICCAAYGKRSNLDIKWNRDFLNKQDKKLDNFLAVKYHITTEWRDNVIGLHNFENGYCGISKIEDGLYCLCYMTRAENLKKSNNKIEDMEKAVLYKNPHLKNIFERSTFINGFPVTISQINFNKKSQTEQHVLMLGDASGMITPLCGNGMSIALHTAKISASIIDRFLKEEISREEMEKLFTSEWQRNFSGRLKTGRIIQKFFGSNLLSNVFVQLFRTLPFLSKPVISMTHGKPF